MRISYRSLFAAASIYLILPLIIFFFAFVKIIWAVPLTVLFAGAAVLAYRSIGKEKYINVSIVYVLVAAILCCAWAYIAGIAEFAWTTPDHTARYAILNDLVNYDWPVFYDLSQQSNPAVRDILGTGETVAFAYYFFFWLVPALIGKAFGLFAGRVALIIWSGLGLLLTTLVLNFMQKSPKVTALILFFVFGGFDFVIFLYYQLALHIDTVFDGWNVEFNIHGNFFQTMNTFNQSIPCWLITALLMSFPNNKHTGTIASLSFAYSPWVTFGLLPLAVCQLIKDKKQRTLKNIVTPGNLVIPAAVLAVFGTFFTANSGATGVRGFIWHFFAPDYALMIRSYLLYVIIEFGIWCAIIFKDQKSNPMYWTALATLLIMPVWKITEANDFLMRGSLAPVFVITVLVLFKLDDALVRLKKNGNDIKAVGVVVAVFISSLTALLLLYTSIGSTMQIYNGTYPAGLPKDSIVSFGDIRDEYFTEVTSRQVYVYDYEDKPFYQIFGK